MTIEGADNVRGQLWLACGKQGGAAKQIDSALAEKLRETVDENWRGQEGP